MTMLAAPPATRPEQLPVALLDAVAAEPPAELAGEVALHRARVLVTEAERLRILALQALSDVETRELFTLDGASSTAAWVRSLPVTGFGRADVALARRLRTLPAVDAELRAGRLPLSAASVIGRAVGKARPFLDRPDGRIDGQPAEPALHATLVDGICALLAEQTGGDQPHEAEPDALRTELTGIAGAPAPERERLEAALVLFAQRCDPGLLPSAVALLLDALLPAEHDARAAAAEDRAGLDLRRSAEGSGWTIRRQLDDETGELLNTVLSAQQQVDPAAPRDTDAWRAAAADPDLHGLEPQDWPSGQPRPRSRRQLRHAALTSALQALLGSGMLGVRDKVRPHLLITVSLDYLNGHPGALPARAVSGARWTRRQLAGVACTSVFTRLVLDARHRVVESSHTERTLKGFERHILHVQWGGSCAGTGCTRGPATGHNLVPHHVTPYRVTGTTGLDDTVPLCECDHHELHDNGRLIRLKDGRWIGPDGPVDPPGRPVAPSPRPPEG